jgi:hypothetical protein
MLDGCEQSCVSPEKNNSDHSAPTPTKKYLPVGQTFEALPLKGLKQLKL